MPPGIGGDEFVMLPADAEPAAVAERIRDLDRMVADAGARVCGVHFLRLSAGAAFFPEDGRDPEELLATRIEPDKHRLSLL